MQLTLTSSRVWLATEPVDFRCSIIGLTALVHTQFELSPCESIFIFYNRQRDKLKILAWHGNGFMMIYKCLEKGRFTVQSSESSLIDINNQKLSWLLAGLDWVKMSSWNDLSYGDFS